MKIERFFQILSIGLLLVLLYGCGSLKTADLQSETSKNDIIFTAKPLEIRPGDCTILVWEAPGAFGTVIDGEEFPPEGQVEMCPAETRNFELIFDMGTHLETRTIQIIVSSELAQSAVVGQPPSNGDLVWVRTGGPPGGLGYDIRYNFDNHDIWYVTDAWGGLHISLDRGTTWKDSSSGIPGQGGPSGDTIPVFCLTVDPHDTQILWTGTDKTGHIYKSYDGGHTWQQHDQGIEYSYDALSIRGFTVDPRSSDIVYAMGETMDSTKGGDRTWMGGTGGVIFRTIDGGENWELIWDGGVPSSLARYMWIDPADPQVLFVSTGIFDRSAIGENNSIEDPFGGIGVLKSVDGGSNWQALNKENGLQNLYIGSLFMHPENPDILLAAAGHVFEPDTLPYIERLQAEGTPSPMGVYRTMDGGETWSQRLAGFEVFTVVELCPSDPDIGYAGSDVSIYRSEDAGETWIQVASPWGPPGVTTGFPIDMQCDPDDPDRIFINNYGGGNFLSEDGGATWVNASSGYTGARIFSVAVDPDDASRVFSSGIWRSDDGGTTWIGMHFPPADDQGFDTVVVDPADGNHLLAGKKGIVESVDGGATWELRWSGLILMNSEVTPQLVNKMSTVIKFAPSDPDIIYAGFGAENCLVLHEMPSCTSPGLGIILSQDNGATWQQAVDSQTQGIGIIDLAVDPWDARIVYAATGSGVYKSSDSGVSWSLLTGLPENLPIYAVAVDPADSSRILVGVDKEGVYQSRDGGLSWNRSGNGLELNGSLHDLIFDPVNTLVVYASDFTSGVYRSVDGGETWTKIIDGMKNRAAMGLSLSADGKHLYVGTYGDGVYRLDIDGSLP